MLLNAKYNKLKKEKETRPKTFIAVIVVTRGDEVAEIEIPVRATSERFAHETVARLFKLSGVDTYEHMLATPHASLIIKES